MSEWDFLWDLEEGEDLLEAISNGMSAFDIRYIEEQENKKLQEEWERLKKCVMMEKFREKNLKNVN